MRAGHYAAQVERYLERFGSDQVHVLLFEDLRDDADAVVEQALRFVGVDPALFVSPAEKTHNATAFPKLGGLDKTQASPDRPGRVEALA